MNQSNIQALILAAGKSTRFNTGRTKLLEKICGQEMVLYVTKLLQSLSLPTCVVVGHQAELVKKTIIEHHTHTINFVEQREQKGTGHAVLQTQEQWFANTILIINGDMPLITQEILENMFQIHAEKNATITFAVSHNTDPSLQGYGRVVQENDFIKIIEAKDFSGDIQQHCCINAGIYLIQKDFLHQTISQLSTNNNAQEFYLTDLIYLASQQKHMVQMVQTPFDRIRGINTLKELWTAEQIKRADIISSWMEQGVRFYAAQAVHVDVNVHIGAGTIIGCGVHLLNNTIIGKQCTIDPFTIINNSTIADNSTIYSHCVLTNCALEPETFIGPFAHINQAIVGTQSIIGNFVEIKKSCLGKKTKAKHLSFIGNTQMGQQVNIGAGTITCNYDGANKHQTIIEDNVFIGSNNTLIAPLTIGANAYTAAGSVINSNVPARALAIGRARQINKEDYATKIKEQNNPQNQPFIAAMKIPNNDSTLHE